MTDSYPMRDQTALYAYEGLLTRRMLAFVIDYAILLAMMIPAAIAVFVIGVVTFGLGFYLYPILFFVVAALYFGLTLSAPAQASLGMRVMDVRMVRETGEQIDFVTAILHLVTFWILNSILTPLVLLVGLFTERKRLLHDILIGTSYERAASRRITT